MNKMLFSKELNGSKIAKTLSLCATILQVAAIVLAIIVFLVGTIFSIVSIAGDSSSSNEKGTYEENTNTNSQSNYYSNYTQNDTSVYSNSSTSTQNSDNSATLGVVLLLASVFLAVYIFIALSILALLFKSLAAIVLHTYISALNTDKIADNTLQHP